MYSNNILNFQVFPTNLNACTKKSGKLLKEPHILGIDMTLKYTFTLCLTGTGRNRNEGVL